MIGLIKDWYHARRAQAQLDVKYARVVEDMFGQLSQYQQPFIDNEGMAIGPDLTRGLRGMARAKRTPMTIGGLNQARDAARQLARESPHARNVMNQITNHVVGRGFTVRIDDKAANDQWAEVSKQINWQRRRREIVRRIVREGEALLRKFDGTVRFVEPEDLKGNSDAPLGVYVGEDAEDAVAYNIDGEKIDADEIFHIMSPDSDVNEVRGWPLLYDAQPLFEDYENFVRDRAVLNRFRSTVLMFQKFKGMSVAQMKSMHDKVKTGTWRRGATDIPLVGFQRGRVIQHSDDVEYDFKSPNLGSNEAEVDGRAMRLQIATFFSMPEYMSSSDASNANFASTAVAESPGVLAMQAWQDVIGGDVARFVEWMLNAELDVTVTFPVIISRDEGTLTNARNVRYQAGVLSKKTWIEEDGKDPEKELARIAEEGTG